MRVSIDKQDPGYMPVALGSGVKILLDGVEQTHVITADEEKRYLLRYVTPLRISSCEQECLTEELRGTVRIIEPESKAWRMFEYSRDGGWRIKRGNALGGLSCSLGSAQEYLLLKAPPQE